MFRDPRLRPLSREHHHALVLARRAQVTGDNAGASSPESVWAEVIRRFAAELAPHFEIEERLLLPALEAAGEVALAERTRAEHSHLRSLVVDDTKPLALRLTEFGRALREHVHFEEQVLFPAIEARVSAEVLDAVDAECRRALAVPEGSAP